MTTNYEIEIASFNSAGIQDVAELRGATHMRFLGIGTTEDENPSPDSWIGFYEFVASDGSKVRVANTNSDPIWGDGNEEEFANLAEACGVSL